MSAIGRTAAVVAVGTVMAMPLSAAPLPGFVLKAQTEHFSFYTRDGAKVDAAKSERYLTQVERMLGQQVSGKAEYYRYGNAQEVAAGTGTYAEGVTFAHAGQIHSTQEFHAHEIVHLVAGQMGKPGAFFQEGLAVALGNEGRWLGKDVHKTAAAQARTTKVSALIARFGALDANVAYPVAGSFVASLIKTHGIDKVAAFFRACTGSNTAEAFTSTFGQTLDEAGATWVASL
jgi:hypothetical protein